MVSGKMKTIELFCGTKSFSKVAQEYGHKVFTIDYDARFNPDLTIDVLLIKKDSFPYQPDILWASPPCTCFSVASIGTHWTGGNKQYIPNTDKAKYSISLILKTFQIIDFLKPKYWFVENPRGILRKLSIMKDYKRITTTYCQYGDNRMKPTDIWTNTDIQLKPPCKNGSICHVRAPRGSRTGTQGLKNAKERGIVPKQLCESIIKFCV